MSTNMATMSTNMATRILDLPQGWTVHKTKDGRQYYYNASTKTSSWKKPEAPAFENDGSFLEKVKAVLEEQETKASAVDAKPKVEESKLNAETLSNTGLDKDSVTSFNKSEADSAASAPSTSADDEAGSESGKRKADQEADSRPSKPSRFKSANAPSQSDAATDYLRQVQQLQSMDRQTDSTGGKWLVR